VSAPRIPHQPALDGIRGLAVAVILLFHSHFAWAQGAFLSLSTFFTLSGFLITRLLLVERARSGHIALGRFWARRMRRLMPASLLTLAGVLVYGVFAASQDQLARLRGDVLWTLAYLANWRFILTQVHYTALFVAPSPVLHFWSLGIEEQFYAVYPLLVAGVLALARGSRRMLAATLAALAAGSVALSSALYAAGASVDRIYFGTDTRAAEFLVGGLLAVLLSGGPLPARAQRGIRAAGSAALALSLLLWTRASLDSSWPYRGGLGAYALLTAGIVAAAVQPGGAVRTLLSWRPLRWLGRISYGVYLFHWPLFLWLSPERTGLAPLPLLALRLGVVFGLADLSYRFFEQPIRRGRALTAWRPWLAAPAAVAALLAGLWGVTVQAPHEALEFSGNPLAAAAPAGAAGRGPGGATYAVSPQCARIDREWAESIARNDPDLVVVLMGHWDLHTRRLPGDSQWRAPGDPVFDAYLRSKLLEAVDLLSARGALVVWLTSPVIDPPHGRRPGATHAEPARTLRYNELLSEVEALRPEQLRIVDLAGYFARRARDPAAHRLRPDGVHLTHESAFELMDAWLGEEILRAWDAAGGARRPPHAAAAGLPR
jgi:peptidoglycan/LPS O-acetylase OafA/YrhL